jgi:hypothetical protein
MRFKAFMLWLLVCLMYTGAVIIEALCAIRLITWDKPPLFTCIMFL